MPCFSTPNKVDRRASVLEYTGLLSGRRGPYLGQLQGCSTTIISREESTTASYWDSKITTPLIIFMGLEGFQSIIINVQKLIVNGVFHNLREVELKLMYDGQVSLPQLGLLK